MTKSIFAITLIIVFFGVTAFVFYKKGNSYQEANVGLNLEAAPTPTPAANTENTMTKLDNGLQVQDLKIGAGPEAKAGDTISVNYVGALANGAVFDASDKHGGPATFQIGVGQLIKGWDIGIPGMKVGGKRKLVVPSSLGYGSQNVGNGLIPPNSTLIFEVELLAVQTPLAK